MSKRILFFALLLRVGLIQAQSPTLPGQPSIPFEKWLSIRQAGSAVLSPNGASIAYTVTSTDWKENSYDAEIWLSRQGQPPFQLTNNPKGSSISPKWSPDSKWIAFLSDRGDKSQLYLISAEGGEAFPLTKEDDNVNAFAWSPDGHQIAFLRNDTDSKSVKSIKDHYGAFGEEGNDYKLAHLWLIRFSLDSLADPLRQPDSAAFPVPTCLTTGNFTITNFVWSPDSRAIAYNRQPDPFIPSSIHAAIDVLDLPSQKIRMTVADPAGDQLIAWSPDGGSLLYSSSVTDTISEFYRNNRLFISPVSSAPASKEIAAAFDENKSVVDWNPKGIFFTASQHTKNALFHIDPASDKIDPVNLSVDIVAAVSFTKDGRQMAFTGRQYNGLNEIYGPAGQLTHLTDQHGLVFRYIAQDGLSGKEGSFLLCTFWLAQAQAMSGQLDRAKETFTQAVSFANDIGLLSEEILPDTKELLGNFPQAFSHIGLVNAAWAIFQRENAEAGDENHGARTVASVLRPDR